MTHQHFDVDAFLEATDLNSDHRDVVKQLFAVPASENIEWRRVRSLLEALGAVAEERRGRALREVERLFALSPELVIVAGFDGYWKRVNPSVETVLGYSERESLTRPFMDFVHSDDRERTEEEARRVVGGETAPAFTNRI